MRTLITIFFMIAIACPIFVLAQYQYLSPLPGSRDHNPECSIIIRDGMLLDARSASEKSNFEITGSISGEHNFNVVFCRDQKTIILNPARPFATGEKVTVKIGSKVRRVDGTFAVASSFSFFIHRPYSAEETDRLNKAREEEWFAEFGSLESSDTDQKKGPNAGASLPPMFITTNTNPAPGEIFFHNYNFYGYPTYHHCIITNDGDSIYSSASDQRGWDFKINRNGYITMYKKLPARFEMFDSSLIHIGNFSTQGSYLTDIHDFQIFPDGHYYLQGYSYSFMDLTVYDPTYHPNATVTGLVIQKFDQDKNMVFQWRSIDHIPVIEAPHANFSSSKVDYVHGNSIDEDFDGHIIISCRHLDQVNKIDVNTGEFIWRLGGIKNEFMLENDSVFFTYQHDARRLPNGNITLFDNGNFHGNLCSYAREYHLDEVNKVATSVWTYKHPQVNGQNVYGSALGSVQRLSNGNTLINWGAILPGKEFPNLTEVTPGGEIVWEMRLKDTYNDVIYRAHKYEWDPCPRPLSSKLKAKDITSVSANLKWHAATGAGSYKLQHRKVGDTDWLNKTIDDGSSSKTLNNLLPDTEYEWHVKTICTDGQNSTYSEISTFTTLPQKLQADGEVVTLSLFPNPADRTISLNCNEPFLQPVSVSLVNMLGVSVFRVENYVPESFTPLVIPVDRLIPGPYLIHLDTGNHHWTEKVMIE